MEHRAADYFVKGKQLERLVAELEKVEAFHKLITDGDGCLAFEITLVEDGLFCSHERLAEDTIERAHEKFSDGLRELKYLVEDISSRQELVFFEG